MANIGINLLETDGKATPSIQASATSRAGFIGGTQRGVPGVVKLVTNFTEYAGLFGRFKTGFNTPFAVKGFFDNGGSMAYVTRVYVGTVLSGTAKAVNLVVNAVGTGALTISAGYRGQLDPGPWAHAVTVDVFYRALIPAAQGKPAVPASFDLTIKLDGKQVESWTYLPVDASAVAKINDEFTGSQYVTIALDLVKEFKVGLETLTLAGGVEAPAGALAKCGSAAGAPAPHPTIHPPLLSCPDMPDALIDGMLSDAEQFCRNRGDCLYVTHAEDKDAAATTTWGASKRASNMYAAAYWPRIRVQDPESGSRWIPPTGHVMGVMARTDQQRGVWKAPAGNDARVSGALDVKYHISDATHTSLVKDGSVNAVRFVSGQGIVVDSARTMSTNVLWQYVNVRLLFNFVKSSLKAGLRWVVYEPNDDALWKKIKHNSVTPFLMGLWRRGAFGPGSPDQVFSVKCDAENNPPANIQQGILNVEVYFYPSRPAETFILTVGQQEGGGSASES